MTEPPPQSRLLDRLRALVLADERLQAALAPIEEPAQLAGRVLALAAANGIALEAGDVTPLVGPDPVGMFRLSDPVPMQASWPSPAWRPVALFALPGGGAAVDWAHFAGASLSEPFFGLSAVRAERLPFNRLFRYRTRLEDFVAGGSGESWAPPAGFIFHMSRSGSTLVAQMLAALPGSLVISEAPPLDAMVRVACGATSSLDPADALRAMVGALGRRGAGSDPAFVKLHFWHALALPLFRRAFPTVPWLFLHRDPVEVVVSQMRSRGAEMMTGMVPMLGIGPDAPAEEQIAAALEGVCAAALDAAASGGGLFVDHADLPGAVFSHVLAHFGVDPGAEGRAAMAAAAVRDAKAPIRPFAPDARIKQREASAQVRRAADLHLAAVDQRLKALGGEAMATR
jgi:hypothetical protein